MAFRFKRNEPVADGVQRIAEQQLDKSIQLLQSPARQTDEQLDNSVHDVRTNLKCLRALLRLVRPHIGDKRYHHHNTALRDAGRQLAAARDAAVLIQTFNRLLDDAADAQLSVAARPLREKLAAPAGQTPPDADAIRADRQQAMAEVMDQLRQTRCRVGDWRPRAEGFAVIRQGLQATYRRGRTALDQVIDQPTAEHLHEWRKQVKYLWYDVRMLQPCWPAMLKAYRKALKQLSDQLGQDHDLVMLDHAIEDLHRHPPSASAANRLRSVITKRRAAILRQVLPLGRRVYADKPKLFIQRMENWFDLWRRQTKP